MLFMAAKREEIRRDNEGFGPADVAKEAGRLWKLEGEDSDLRKLHEAEATALREKYKARVLLHAIPALVALNGTNLAMCVSNLGRDGSVQGRQPGKICQGKKGKERKDGQAQGVC